MASQSHPSIVSLKSAISVIKKRPEIVAAWEINCASDQKRKMQFSNNTMSLNTKVMEFFTLGRQENIPVLDPLFQEEALKMAVEMGITDFKACNGWLEKFRMRHNIDFKILSGESVGLVLYCCIIMSCCTV